MRVTIRQGIVAAPTVASAPSFLQNSAGNINVVVSNVPVVFTFAHGGANYLASEQASVTNAWGPFTGPTTNHLYWELDEATGQIVRGSTTLPPAVGSSAPVSPATGQMWFNTTNTTMFVWNGTVWKTTIRVLAGEADGSSVTPAALGSQVGVTGNFRAGYVLRDGSNKPIRVTTDPNTGAQYKFLTTETEVVSAGNDGSVVKFENAAVFVRGGEVIPAFSLVYAYAAPAGENTALLVGLASSTFVDFETKAAIGMVVESLATNEVTQLVTGGIVFNNDWDWLEAQIGQPLYCGPAGEVTLTKPGFAKVRCIGTVFSNKEVLLNFGWETDFDGGVVGASGYSGFSGAGTSGFSGYSGAAGNAGTSGYSGAEAASGFSGYSGVDGASGFSGYSGVDGASGFSGYSGLDGAAALSGYSGIDGAAGASGYSGVDGASGFSGYSGAGGGVAEPANQVVYGTGAAVDSDAQFTFIAADGTLEINPSAAFAAPGYVFIGSPSSNSASAVPAGNIDIATGAVTGVGADTNGANIFITANRGRGIGTGGNVTVEAGSADTAGGIGGAVSITSGTGGTTGGDAGALNFSGGAILANQDGVGGSVNISAGTGGAGTGNVDGGSVTISAGAKLGTGTDGSINLVIPATGDLKVNGSAGTATHVLTSNGAGAAPTWAAAGGPAGASGYSGIDGASGFSGYSGVGTSGFSGYSGIGVTRGTVTLSSGTATVSTGAVTASSLIFITVQSLGTVTVPKAVAVTARTASTDFTITSEDVTDTSVVAWMFMEP